MNTEWQMIQAQNGICAPQDGDLTGAANSGSGPAPSNASSTTQSNTARNDYRWTPACQRLFLEELACTGSVMRAAKAADKSPRAAYALRFRRIGTAFRLGWDAAILIAQATLHDILMDRALNGYEEIATRHDDNTVIRGKFDNRLSMGLLNRLDRIAKSQALQNSHQAQVQMVCQDYEAFLDLIESGGTGSAAALFCAARDGTADEQISYEDEQAIECELDRISAAENANNTAPAMLEEEPALAAQRLSVWFDDDRQAWMTDFPKPTSNAPTDAFGFDGIEENGYFGDIGYERTLSPAEQTAQISALLRARGPWIDAAAAARDAWFGTKLAA